MSLAVRISDLTTRVSTEFKTAYARIGTLADLTTTAKGSLVAAVNEVNAKPSSAPADATETVKGILELATLAEVATGTDALRAVTAAGVRQERIALKQEILGVGVPAALDTLDELAAALADDANFATSTTTALGNRLRVDSAQGLTTAQQAQGRTNLDVYSKTEIGNPETDFVAVFNTGLL